MQFVRVESKLKIDERLSTIKNILLAWDYEKPCKLEIKPYVNSRSLSQNALMHMWFSQIHDRFTAMGIMVPIIEHHGDETVIVGEEPITADDVKLMMKHKFLGVKDVVRGKLVIKDQLVKTSDLDAGEMTHFLDQVYDWAMDKGIYLPVPEHSVYKKYRERQVR